MIGARFAPDVHNRRRLEEFRGASPEETLERFAEIGPIGLPRKESVGGLGEMIVHSEDIRRPLGIRHEPDPEGLLAVATIGLNLPGSSGQIGRSTCRYRAGSPRSIRRSGATVRFGWR